MPVTYDFSGKTAVVTGGSKGISRAICDQLYVRRQIWNWDVTAAQHDGVKFEKVDVTDGKQIDVAISKVGRVDILVKRGPPVSVEQLGSREWRRVLDVNLTSVFDVSRRVVPLMKRSGWGRMSTWRPSLPRRFRQPNSFTRLRAPGWWLLRRPSERSWPTRRSSATDERRSPARCSGHACSCHQTASSTAYLSCGAAT